MSPFLLAQAVLSVEYAKPLIEGAATIAVAIGTWVSRQGDRRTRSEIKAQLTEHAASMERGISDLRGIVIGPDGKNGLRQRIEEIRSDVKECRRSIESSALAEARLDVRVENMETKVTGLEERERER